MQNKNEKWLYALGGLVVGVLVAGILGSSMGTSLQGNLKLPKPISGEPGPAPETSGITRGQLSQLLVNTAKWSINTNGGPHFPDVPASNPYYNYIETWYNQGNLITSYPDGTFRPDAYINRAEAAKIFSQSLLANKSCPLATTGTYYKDVSVSDWYYPYVKKLADCKMTDIKTGSNKNFSPGELLTSSAADTMVSNYNKSGL